MDFKHFAAKLIAVSCLSMAHLTVAYSASLTRLDDGRIVIKAFGERLAFREKDAVHIDFFWTPYHCDPKDPSGTTVARWREDPAVAECLNRSIPDDVASGDFRTIYFKVSLVRDDGLIYPGAINPEGISQTSMVGRSVVIGLGRGYRGAKCADFSFEGPSDEIGSKSSSFGKSPRTDLYSLPGDHRLNQTSRPLCVLCSELGSGCAVRLDSLDKAVFLSLGWKEWALKGPQPTWIVYDRAARQIASSIFIDRLPGDFQ